MRESCSAHRAVLNICTARLLVGVIYFENTEPWFGREIFKEPVKYERSVQIVFATGRSGCPSDKRSSFLPVSGHEEGDGGLLAAKIATLLTLNVRESIESQECSFCSKWR